MDGSEINGNKDPAREKLLQVQNKVDQLKDQMHDNISNVLERGEKIDVVVEKAETLKETSGSFSIQTKNLKNKMWWKNFKMYAIITATILIILAIIIAIIASSVESNSQKII